MKSHYCYILECADQSLYTGYTVNLKKRFEAHSSGKGAKYTRSHGVSQFRIAFKCDSASSAMKLECAIKKLTRAQKVALIKGSYAIDSDRDYGILEIIKFNEVNDAI